MTYSGTIALDSLQWIKIYFNTHNWKSTTYDLKRMLREADGDFIMNASIFLRNGKPACYLKADGKKKCTPNYDVYGFAWGNNPVDFSLTKLKSCTKDNYIHDCNLITMGQPIAKPNYGADRAYACHRTAIGTKQGRFAYYVTQTSLKPEKLRDTLKAAGWDNAIMLDGGGSTCFMNKNGNGFTGDGRIIPFFIVVKKKKQTDNEPKGDKPVVTINAYSKTKDGAKKLSSNFKVSEFACKDGSDAVLVAPKLVMVLQTIRDHYGKAIVINSAYRTPQYNTKVGGAAQSQHCYGTAADITISGVTPKEVAQYARKLMPDYGGVGIYATFTHIDVRDVKADWSGNT